MADMSIIRQCYANSSTAITHSKTSVFEETVSLARSLGPKWMWPKILHQYTVAILLSTSSLFKKKKEILIMESATPLFQMQTI
jgi:hypothetical protein